MDDFMSNYSNLMPEINSCELTAQAQRTQRSDSLITPQTLRFQSRVKRVWVRVLFKNWNQNHSAGRSIKFCFDAVYRVPDYERYRCLGFSIDSARFWLNFMLCLSVLQVDNSILWFAHLNIRNANIILLRPSLNVPYLHLLIFMPFSLFILLQLDDMAIRNMK